MNNPMYPVEGVGAPTVAVLLVSPAEDDFHRLNAILNETRTASPSAIEWFVLRHGTPNSALAALRRNSCPILVCDADLAPDCWRFLLEEFTYLADPPLLIVTSRLADERLWADALNAGAWDVLVKPLDAYEVSRVLSTAWLHWRGQQEAAKTGRAAMVTMVAS